MKFRVLTLSLLLTLGGCALEPLPEKVEPAYGSNYERFVDNVRIKQQSEFGITYEYKDVRIDEIAYMASEYCYEQNGKKAVLHDSRLFKNFSRRATFDCI